MKKVYIIRYEDCYSGDFSSGTAYVYSSLEEAEKCLKEIKEDEIYTRENGGLENVEEHIHDLITENGFIVDYFDEYTKYVIEEEEIR